MKKLSLLLVVLLAAGSAGLYGQMAIGTNFTITGDATATAGYDIDDEQFGFKNEFNSTIKIGFVFCADDPDGDCKTDNSDKVDMSGGWYGSIELKDFRIAIDSEEEDSTEYVHTTAKAGPDGAMPHAKGVEEAKSRTGLYVIKPTIVATLKNGPLWLRIFDEPASKADLIGHIENDEDGDNAAESNDDGKDVGVDLAGPGVTVGYTTSDLSIAIGVMSEEAYDSESELGVKDDPKTLYLDETKAPYDGSYAVSADLSVNVGPATVALQFVQALASENPSDRTAANPDKTKWDDTGIAAKLTTNFGDVSLSAAADVVMTGDEDIQDTEINEAMSYDAGAGATVTLTPNTSLASNFLYSTSAAAATDVEVVLSDKSGLVENLSMGLTWGLFDINGGAEGSADKLANDKSDLFLEGSLGYAIPVGDSMDGDDMMMKGPTLTPSTKVTINQIDGGDAAVGLELQALVEHAIPATTFGLKWKTAQLVDTDTKPAQSGTVTVWTKIKY